MIKSNNSIKKITITYLISLIPLIIYGFYKNGIMLYNKKLVGIFGLFKPIIFLILGILIGALVNLIYETYIKKNKDTIIDKIFSSFHIVYGALISCIVSINTNIFLFIIISFLTLFLSKFVKNKLNFVALCALIIFFIMNIFGKFSFLNIYETTNNLKLDTIDYLIGRGSGGIFTTSIIALIISFLILYFSKTYKKVIPIFSIISFFSLVIIYCIFKSDIGNILNMTFTNGILFSFIYIANEPTSSSYTKKGQIIYGLLVGITTFLLYLIQPALSVLGAILIASILHSLIDLKFE